GENERYFFNVVAISGTYEVNDTLATATPVVFSASGTATFTGVTLGDGIFAGLDVDIFRLELARGGQVTAEVIAKRLPTGSSLDSYLRLFNANGQELANNDQFYGQDSFIDYYVSTGGVYYVAVSGFGNSSYNATVGGSGTPQSTGLYSLRIQANLNTDDLVSAATNFEVPLRVPSIGTQGTVESSLQISDTRQILDVNVQVRLRHSFVSDVIMTLVSPSGTEVVLVNRRGGSGQDMTPTLFDDEAPQSIVTGSAPFAGSFRAEESLGRFDGQAAAGTWTLRIEDVAGLNSGELDGWRLDLRLENNIFGPFEPNDTLPNARDLTQISATGFGTATISAFLGDGGFGLMDRDFYKFSVAAGASMTAASISGADTALRLFTAQGTQLLLAADAGSTNARIENYVFNDSGTYYLAVSAGSNTAYDPFNVASGVAAASTGSYTLVVSMTDGVSDGSLALRGERLSMGLGTDGLLYSAGGGVGMRYDGIEFLYRQSAAAALPRTFFGAATDGTVFLNARQNQAPLQTSQLPFSLTDQSDSFNARGVAKALFNGNLRIERTVSMGKTDTFAAIDVLFTNQGTTSIASLSWMEGFNPEMGLNLDPESATTDNDIDASGRLATATFTNNQYQGGLTVGLAAPSADPRATAMVVSPSIVQSLRDPTQLLAITPTDPNGANTDFHLALVYDLGTVTPGETVALRYFVFFGDSKSSVEGLYGVLNAGTGSGHLTADPTSPADEVLADGSPVPQLPYRYYFPEGFATPSTNTFIPILNLNDQAARVVVIARYETGVRDQVIAEFAGESSIAANSRSGVTITSPFLFSTGSQLVRPYEGYAVEIRSDRPLAATFSHYDTNLTTTAASIGESFTTRVSTTWTVPEVAKGGSSRDFLLYYNTADTTSKVDFTFYPSGGGQTYTLTQVVEGNRRLGINLHDLSESQLPSGANGTRATYGVKVESQTPLVVVLSQYDLEAQTAEGATGLPNLGSTVGATSEGDLGLDATSERLAILNATPQSAEVSLVFLFGTGSSYRSVVTVGPASQRIVEVGSLPGFPVGQRYSMQFSSTRPVTVSLIADSFGDQLVSGVTDRAYRLWGFGEGFKPRDGNPLVTETLRLYNPNANDTIAEIILRYDAGLGTESRRVVVPARASFSIDLHEMVTGSRRTTEVWYGISVKSAAPIVASMTHADAFFPGAFSTLGTPLGDGVGI
nr:pre-peptidase C-terminal domain-containing protein [Phycisphaerales bacterium]